MNNKKRKFINYILISLIIIFIVISICIIINIKENSKIKYEKTYYEIEYLDTQIINMTNLLNVRDLNIDWRQLENLTNKIYNYWNSVILDLNNTNIDKQKLADFGKDLDNLLISIKSMNKQVILNNLCQLYNKLVLYNQMLDNQNPYNNVMHAKYNLLLANYSIENNNWTIVYEYILKSDEYISNIVNSLFESDNYNEYNIKQSYVAIKELENIINVKDRDIFYIKYNIAMEKLGNI